MAYVNFLKLVSGIITQHDDALNTTDDIRVRHLDVTGDLTVSGSEIIVGSTTFRGTVNIGDSVDDIVTITSSGTTLTGDGQLTLGSLSADKLVYSSSGLLTNTDLSGWVADFGSGNISVADDGSGGITLNTAQDIAAADSPTFAGLTVVNAITEFSTDGTLAGDSDSALPTEKAVKLYVDTELSTLSGSMDHGGLLGLGDDDHTQYILHDGTRAFTGNVQANASGTLDIGSSGTPFAGGYFDDIYVKGTSIHLGNVVELTEYNYTDLNINTDIRLTATNPNFYTPAGSINVVFKLGDAAGSSRFEVADVNAATVFSIDSNGQATCYDDFKFQTGYGPAAVAAGDLYVTMGDAIGAKKVSFRDSTDAEVAWIDSDGNASFTTISGAIISDSSVDHGGLSGLADDDHTQYFLADGTRNLSGILTMEATTSSTTGVIYKGATAFLHDFKHPTGGAAAPYGRNVFIGEGAGNFTMGSTAAQTWEASQNIALGHLCLLANTTGYQNIALGLYSLENNTTGYDNISLGVYSLRTNVGGYQNIALGLNSLRENTEGHDNIALGRGSLYLNTEGFGNIALGYESLFEVTTGDYNTAIGYNTGRGITTGGSNTIIGAQVTGLAEGLSNTVIIADGAGNKRIYVDSGVAENDFLVVNASGTFIKKTLAETGAILEADINHDNLVGFDAGEHFTEGSIDHGSIAGLADDDHTQYLLADGTRALTGNWNAGNYNVTVGGDLTASGTVTAGGTTPEVQFSATSGTIGVSGNTDLIQLTGTDVTFDGDILFTTSGTYDIGTSAIPVQNAYFDDIYVKGTSIHLGGTVELTESSSELAVNTNMIFPADKGLKSTSASNLYMTLGDNAGSNTISFRDSDGLEVAWIDSNGNASFQGDVNISGSVSGTQDHAAMINLDYASSGHTGFASSAALSSHTGDSTIHFTEASIDHGSIGGLGDDDHTMYIRADGTRDFSGSQIFGANVTISGTLGFDAGTTINEFSTDTALAGDSDDAVPTEKAVKAYVDAQTTGSGITDHGGLLGLSDDDHTQYSLVDGTRAFSSTVGGVTPVADADLATKGYVDSVAVAPDSMTVASGTTTAIGSVLYVSANDTVAEADKDDSSATKVVGLARTVVIGDGALTVDVQADGILAGALVGATAGTRYYLSDDGGVSSSPPSETGDYVLLIGIAANATDLFVRIGDAILL